ncbi:P-loop containing nucleoside triphosphate hydrolase protein [Desarmillaria tabescens]|uniref:ATP-dependent DNA helicase n=1 Tax=Armillaria tabescens TaxID=1929756 RepID=A0AA39JE98_ARMTA|nr:P-loop containing nucleoside triphosphate hydrolase protein [Desarmillaria tabescens]KAK0441171.1 P-loop containing nucleoside triphosphate hydrolase protein [Desarmillaria tabescens]
MNEKLRSIFKLKSFRPGQEEIISAALDGRDVLALMPTGGGKSLCFQLPAVCVKGRTKGVTVVISPLRALMHDQIDDLHKKGIDAILTGPGFPEYRARLQGRKLPSLVYVTPEMLERNEELLDMLSNLNDSRRLARLVIDEAHCLPGWGKDFRKDYDALGSLRERFPGVPIMALTASATRSAILDIVQRLRLSNPFQYEQSFNRPNLTYSVLPKPKGHRKAVDNIASFISSSHADHSGVIYCLTRKTTEKVAAYLRESGIRAKHYHAELTPAEKTKVQNEWKAGECKVIVSTTAFGMGIDKADVRYVIHYDIPRNLVGLYQETGRAGRDGNPADCVLYYRYGDFTRLIHMIRNPTDPESTTKETREEQEREAYLVMQYCVNNIDCRRQQILFHFGEHIETSSCDAHCDSCLSDTLVLDQDVTLDAINVVKVVGMLEEGDVTIEYCRDVFRGKTTATVRGRLHHMSRLFGVGRHLPQTLTERLFSTLLSKGILDLHFSCDSPGRWHTTYVKLGPAAHSFLLESEDKQMLFMKVRQEQKSPQLKTSKQAGAKRPKPLRQKHQANDSESEDDLYIDNPRDEETSLVEDPTPAEIVIELSDSESENDTQMGDTPLESLYSKLRTERRRVRV